MTVQQLRAILVNIVDDMPVYITVDGVYIPLKENMIDILTFDGGEFIGPTVLIIHND